jgi:lipopolysaccharide export system protein LptA
MELRRKLPAALVVLIFAGLISLPVGEGGRVRLADAAEEPETPVTITADKMEYYSDRDVVIFTGNALAVRGDITLSADRMKVTLGQGVESEENSVRKIVAEGDVNFRHIDPETGNERFATGERGEYHADGERVDLTGKPRVWEGKNVVTGEKMSFYIDENRFVVLGEKGKPVGLTIYQEKKGKE